MRALLICVAALGCTAEPTYPGFPYRLPPFDSGPGASGGQWPDASPPDAQPIDAASLEDPPEPGPPLSLHDLRLYGSYQSYHLLDPPIDPGTDFEHADFPTQLGSQGVRHAHFNLVYNNADTFMVFNHGFQDGESRCRGSIHECFDPMGAWSRANPRHVPIVVVLEKTVLSDGNIDSVLDRLQDQILNVERPERGIKRHQIFTMDDLRAFHPGRTVREIVTDPALGWPPLDAMRGTFIFVIAEPLAREAQRELLWGLDQEDELLFWLYADGESDDELAADDAAIALFEPPEDAADAARIQAVVDQGFITWVPAHDAETWARAEAAGAHLISTKYPDRFFPAPGADGWPAACNPRTAPDGCQPRQIENRRPPDRPRRAANP